MRLLQKDTRADYVLANPPFNPIVCGTNFFGCSTSFSNSRPDGIVGFVLVRFCLRVKH